MIWRHKSRETRHDKRFSKLVEVSKNSMVAAANGFLISQLVLLKLSVRFRVGCSVGGALFSNTIEQYG